MMIVPLGRSSAAPVHVCGDDYTFTAALKRRTPYQTERALFHVNEGRLAAATLRR